VGPEEAAVSPVFGPSAPHTPALRPFTNDSHGDVYSGQPQLPAP
jgi:hypothetical protein